MMETPQVAEQKGTRRGLSPAWIAGGATALLVVALLGYALIEQPTKPPQVGSPVPDFQLTALDGSQIDLGAHQGQVVVINFFASWCDPCRQEAADLEQTWREYQGQEVQFFGLAHKDADSKAQAFLKQFDVTYPSAVDPGNRIARAYGVTGVPETFIVDAHGQLIRHFLGPITSEQLSQEIDKGLEP
jgi:cytochrome c biogenesis protein CcmG/thiol:disulfide interchange protein DsbE